MSAERSYRGLVFVFSSAKVTDEGVFERLLKYSDVEDVYEARLPFAEKNI